MKKMGKALLCAMLSLLLFLQVGGGHAVAYNADAVRDARNSVVRIVSVFYFDGQESVTTTGTGFCVGKQGENAHYVVTNQHVVEYLSDELMNLFFQAKQEAGALTEETTLDQLLQLYLNQVDIRVFVMADAAVYEVDYSSNVQLSQLADLALLYIDEPIANRQPAVLGSTDNHKVLDEVFALGYPGVVDIDDINNTIVKGGLEARLAKTVTSGIDHITVTKGEISRLNVITEGISHILHSAEILHGNSGGPLVNGNGEVIGVNTFARSDNIGAARFAIDISTVTAFLKQNKVDWIEAGSGGAFVSNHSGSAEPLQISAYSGTPSGSDRVLFSSAAASSVFPPQGIYSYNPTNVIRDDVNMPWVENDVRDKKGNSGDGIGETITLYFSGQETISALGLHLGFANLTDDVYYGNNRPRMLQFDFSDGSSAQYEFPDLNQMQYVQLSHAVTTNYVKLTILSVYPSNIDEHSTCITSARAYR